MPPWRSLESARRYERRGRRFKSCWGHATWRRVAPGARARMPDWSQPAWQKVTGHGPARGCTPRAGTGPERDVAQSGSAPVWGTGGRRFESGRPDEVELWVALANPRPVRVRASRAECRNPRTPDLPRRAKSSGSPGCWLNLAEHRLWEPGITRSNRVHPTVGWGNGLWRSLVSALPSGGRGRRFESGQPDSAGRETAGGCVRPPAIGFNSRCPDHGGASRGQATAAVPKTVEGDTFGSSILPASASTWTCRTVWSRAWPGAA